MKKLFLSLAVVSLVAGCAQNEVIDNSGSVDYDNPNRISLQPTSAKRAVEVGISTLKTDVNGFEVMATKGIGSQEANLFNGSTENNYWFSANGMWQWKNDTGKDWPAEAGAYPIRFIATYNSPAFAWEKRNEYQPITVADAIEAQKDIMCAVSQTAAAKPANSTVQLVFKHILSNIQFRLKSQPGYKIDIVGLRVCNVSGEGATYNFSEGTWLGLTTKQEKSYAYRTGSLQTITYQTPVSGELKDEPRITSDKDLLTSQTHSLMLLPQTQRKVWDVAAFKAAATAWEVAGADPTNWATAVAAAMKSGAYLELTYKMRDADGKDIVGWSAGNASMTAGLDKAKNYYVKVAYPLDLSGTAQNSKCWVPGKRYTYVIYLGTENANNGTLIEPGFKDKDGGDTGKDVDNPSIDPGNPVTPGKISFDVSVEDWLDEFANITE